MPNRREPYTVAMHSVLCRRARDSPPNELLSALSDWFGAMLQAGGRLSEWAQPKGASELSKVTKNFRGDPKAFCLNDVEFLGDGKRRLSTAFALSHRRQVRYVNITCHEIKKLLRWRSEAFMEYLRNLVVLADRHSAAVVAAGEMPAF